MNVTPTISCVFKAFKPDSSGLFPQFKANELADFPIPQKLSAFEARLAELAAKATQARRKDPTADIAQIDSEIDDLVCRAFELDQDDIKLIEAKGIQV